MNLRHLIIRFFMPLVWRFSEKRKIAALQEFSITELDSGWQSLYAMEFVNDSKIKAMLFQHALEEFYHADMFAGLVRAYANSPLNQPVFTRDAILKPDGTQAPILDFYAYIHVGESEINKDFVMYSRANVESNIKNLFLQIKSDEEEHEASFIHVLLNLAGGSELRLRWILLKFKMKRAYKQYSSLMRSLGEIPLQIILSTIYFLMGPFVLFSLRHRLILSPEEQLKIIQEQAKNIREDIRTKILPGAP